MAFMASMIQGLPAYSAWRSPIVRHLLTAFRGATAVQFAGIGHPQPHISSTRAERCYTSRMETRSLAAAVLTACVWTVLPATSWSQESPIHEVVRPQDLRGWDKTRWGMSEAEVKRVIHG